MAVQIYTFKITYADCDNKIWRIAAVSSNYTLAKLGYMILASFDTMAYHLFEMKFKGTTYFLTEEDFEDLPNYDNERYDLFGVHKIGTLGLNVGDTIQMTYDLGCCQVFNIELLEINDMLRGHGTAYPKILDGLKLSGKPMRTDIPKFIIRAVVLIMLLNGITGITELTGIILCSKV